MKFFIFFVGFVLPVFLSGCSTIQGLPSSIQSDYYTVKNPVQCVPYAREVSGIEIRGDAHTWWKKSAGRYVRGHVPEKGAVLVLSKTARMKYGHLAVVKKVTDSRHIEVTQSNWGNDRKTRSVIYKNMPVKDISAKNDWSKVRFWHYASRSYGRPFVVSGFIYADKK